MDSVVVIGAGPAGVAAADELAQHGVPVVILEAQAIVGGISRTLEFEGARFDVGPHRFFTKNEEILALWNGMLGDDFLAVERLTRIFYRKALLNYPIALGDTLRKVGPVEAAGFATSYLAACLRNAVSPREAVSFEDWVVGQFGRKLFEAFFKTYTEKVWGIPCRQIGAEWAGQRIKGLSLAETVRNALFKPRERAKTLVEQFRFPRLGAGMMYEKMATRARAHGAELLLNTTATAIRHSNGRATAVVADGPRGREEIACSHVLSSNPITQVVLGLDPAPPAAVADAARRLRFRCHLCVNLLVEGKLFSDNWIYVHSRDVQLGRIASYANFSPAMRAPSGASPVTVEYFQFPNDELYRTPDDSRLIAHATGELAQMGLIEPAQVRSGFVVRSPFAYPVLELGYAPHMDSVREYLATLVNLTPIGRGGMFKYNNQDHSIATGLLAARNVMGAHHDLWAVNIDAEYHESGKAQ